MVSSGISDISFALVHSKKTHLMKLLILIIIMKKIARNNVFWRAPEIDFHYETEARKVMVDFQI